MAVHEAQSVDDVCNFVRAQSMVRVKAGGTKPALSSQATLSVRGLKGVIEYEPDEYTFTAWSGTRIDELQNVLVEHGQDLPFDPPLAGAGATLGGTVASGLSGSGRLRFGGVRDFVISGRVVNGRGDVVRGGAKVVKNAAGFDFPKLMVGSLGQFGVLVDLTFKVFPAPESSATLSVNMGDLESAVGMMRRLTREPLDLHCLDLTPPGVLWIRVCGLAAALPARLERIEKTVSGAVGIERFDEDASIWNAVRGFDWLPTDHGVVKVPIVLDQIATVERALAEDASETPRRYAVGGNVLWIGCGQAMSLERLASLLTEWKRPGLVIRGDTLSPRIGPSKDNPFVERLRSVFDPDGKFSGH